MSLVVSEPTLAAHGALIAMINRLLARFSTLNSDIQRGNVDSYENIKFLERLGWQTRSLNDLVADVVNGRYRSTYNNIRMIFEFYLIFDLMSLGVIYPTNYKIRRLKGDASLAEALQRFIASVEVAMESTRPDILEIKTNGKDTVTLIQKGITVNDENGIPTGELVPWYEAMWERYQPDHHLHPAGLPRDRFLTEDWKPYKNRRGRRDYSDQKTLYQRVFTFDALISHLRLNGRLNRKTATRAVVHYNFLSGYSHGTHEALTSVHHSSYDGEIYNHYHSELCLLYISHLLGLHLQLALTFFRRRRIKIRGERGIYRASVHELESEFGYFWFIYNQPHEWDRYDTANRKSDIEKGVVVRPHELRNGDVRFSESPLVRLKQLHSSSQELTTGNIFNSPFHRDDSRF